MSCATPCNKIRGKSFSLFLVILRSRKENSTSIFWSQVLIYKPWTKRRLQSRIFLAFRNISLNLPSRYFSFPTPLNFLPPARNRSRSFNKLGKAVFIRLLPNFHGSKQLTVLGWSGGGGLPCQPPHRAGGCGDQSPPNDAR